MRDRREIQPLYRKALISSNIFLIECVSVEGIRDKREIQPLYRKALISSNIFLSEGMRDRREIQPFYKKALISLNIFLIKCDNGHSLIASTFVSRCESDQGLGLLSNRIESNFCIFDSIISDRIYM
jgi:hypothetical protein